MQLKGYRKNKSSVVATADIDAVATTLKRIEKRDGVITPAAIVAEAKPRTSVLHKYFTWDDAKAAELCRLQEARVIVHAVCYRVENDNGEEQEPLRAFVAVHSVEGEEEFEGRGYLSLPRVMKSEDYRHQIVNEAYEELTSWKHRYEQLKQFSLVFAAIDKTPAPK